MRPSRTGGGSPREQEGVCQWHKSMLGDFCDSTRHRDDFPQLHTGLATSDQAGGRGEVGVSELPPGKLTKAIPAASPGAGGDSPFPPCRAHRRGAGDGAPRLPLRLTLFWLCPART